MLCYVIYICAFNYNLYTVLLISCVGVFVFGFVFVVSIDPSLSGYSLSLLLSIPSGRQT